jgi:hypothetical protein
MVNLKSLFAIVMMFCILLALVGLVRFGTDLWSYHHAPPTATAHLDFRGVAMMVTSLIMAAIFFSLFLMRKH